MQIPLVPLHAGAQLLELASPRAGDLRKACRKVNSLFVSLVWSDYLPSSVGLGLLLLCSKVFVFCARSNRDQFMAVLCMDGAPVLGFLGPLQQIVCECTPVH